MKLSFRLAKLSILPSNMEGGEVSTLCEATAFNAGEYVGTIKLEFVGHSTISKASQDLVKLIEDEMDQARPALVTEKSNKEPESL
jgi:hypothetical protein